MRVVLDSGALIAVDRGDARVSALIELARRSDAEIITTAPVVAQVWRDGARQVRLARLLVRLTVATTSDADARRAGELLAVTATSDVVDAFVALAVNPGDQVLTSDRADIESLVRARNVTATIVAA